VVRIGLSILPPSGFVLAVSDNGVGLPPGMDPASVESLGLSLVHLLTQQLGGTVEFTSGRGLTVRLTVASRRKKPR
jgi:two-component sensor histidine kinase